MRVTKWNDALAMPENERNESREQALERVKALKFKLPPGWKLDRDEANSR